MKKKIIKNKLSENFIINNYLKKLNLKKDGTFNFENDAGYLKLKKNKKLVITSDSISENIDFFKKDNPKSIAKKITTINLSDLSAMGVNPYAYSLNLFLPNYINHNWLNEFTKELLKIQNKYKFYLIGGDLSKSNKIKISSTFFGFSKNNKIISQNKFNFGNDIWITGNLGNSYLGLQILKKKISINNINIKNFFINSYYYPKPCMLGPKISKYVLSMKDISDGFIGDLKKMLKNNYGANLKLENLPTHAYVKKLLKFKKISKKYLLNFGDDYELIVISNSKYRKKLLNIANKYNVKMSLVGKTTKNIQIVDDSNNTLNIPKEFDHFC